MTTKQQAMEKFGFSDSDEFDTLLLDLGIDPELDELTSNQVEVIRKHVTVFASSLNALAPSQEPQEQQPQADDTYIAPEGSMALIANQGLQVAKEAGLDISRGALETLCQMTFDKGRLDAAFIENAYWLGLLRQQNQLRTENTQRLIAALEQQQNQTVDVEKLARDSGLLSNEELVKKLSTALRTGKATREAAMNHTIASVTNW